MACSHGDRSWCGRCDGPMAGETEWGAYPKRYGDVEYLGPLGWEAPNEAGGRTYRKPDGTTGHQVRRSLWSAFGTLLEEYQERVRGKATGVNRAQAQRRRARERRQRARDQALRTQD